MAYFYVFTDSLEHLPVASLVEGPMETSSQAPEPHQIGNIPQILNI